MLLFCAPICYCATILHSCLLPCCYLTFPCYIHHINASHSKLLLSNYFPLPYVTTLLFHAPYLLLVCTPHLLLLCTLHLLLFHYPRLLLHVSHCYHMLHGPLVIVHSSFCIPCLLLLFVPHLSFCTSHLKCLLLLSSPLLFCGLLLTLYVNWYFPPTFHICKRRNLKQVFKNIYYYYFVIELCFFFFCH